jgi:hypothetical protein
LFDCFNKSGVWSGRYAAEDADDRYRRLLRARRKGPRRRRTAEQRDEIATLQSMGCHR